MSGLLVIAVFFAFMWWLARSAENQKLHGKRPRLDSIKIAAAALALAALFLVVLVLVAKRGPQWYFHDVNVLGSGAVLLTVLILLGVGLAAARWSEGASVQGSLAEAAKLLGASLGYIAAMALVLATLAYLGAAGREAVWIATPIMAALIVVWGVVNTFARRRLREFGKQKHAK